MNTEQELIAQGWERTGYGSRDLQGAERHLSSLANQLDRVGKFDVRLVVAESTRDGEVVGYRVLQWEGSS